jgi:hypothetical protein
VFAFKPRAGLLGMLAMLLVGSFATASAEAAPGPFWYHRKAQSQQIKGVKITSQAPLEVGGQGGEQKLKGKVGGTGIELVGPQLQIKGIIYNNAFQAQAKLRLVYIEPKLAKPNFPNCVVTIGTNNVVNVFGHQAWTWNGETKQLEEQKQQPAQKVDWIFLPIQGGELEQGAEELPKKVFTTISFKGAECGVLAGMANVTESVAAEVEPSGVEEWGFSETQKIIEGEGKQHFWNGIRNVGVTTGLMLGGAPAILSGKAQVKVLPRQVKQEQQEVAHYEN